MKEPKSYMWSDFHGGGHLPFQSTMTQIITFPNRIDSDISLLRLVV